VTADLEVRKKGHMKRATPVERDTAHQIPNGRAKDYCQQNTGNAENEIPEVLPELIVNVTSYFE